MKAYKQLAGQTAVYGVSSILGRLLNYLLVPLYTRVFLTAEYGVVTQLYAYAAFLNILFTYGLETTYFRYLQTENNNSKVYSTSLVSIILSTIFFSTLIILFSDPIANSILEGVSNNSLYVKIFTGILALDAITAIPFARLRQENKAKRFAFLRLVNIGLNIGLNIFFLVICPAILKTNPTSWIQSIYHPDFGVGYVFLSNLIASLITLLMMLPEILDVEMKLNGEMWRRMIPYTLPLMIAGMAGMINETFDRILIPMLIDDKADAMNQLGIYGACYKLSIIMTLFIQTFRYAAEPFFFNHSTKDNPQLVYAQVMKYFIIVCSFIFLGVMLYIDAVKLFIGPNFRSGLGVVPILLFANLCLGVFYNLSIWYKLTGKTSWGAWLSIIGAVITLAFNFWLIPVLGYMGAAWATLICYTSIMVISYFVGQKHYPVSYDVKSFFFYISLSLFLWIISSVLEKSLDLSTQRLFLVNGLILLAFIGIIWKVERRKINYLRSDES